VLHCTTNPCDSHTLGLVIADPEKLAGFTPRHPRRQRAIAVTTIQTGSSPVSAATSGTSPRLCAARCDAELPSNP
jgi:hypothetical protein